MPASLHRLMAGGALAAGALTLGFATGGVAGVDRELSAAAPPAATPAPLKRDRLVLHRDGAGDCPWIEREERRPGREL